jgi:hypothetical protein
VLPRARANAQRRPIANNNVLQWLFPELPGRLAPMHRRYCKQQEKYNAPFETKQEIRGIALNIREQNSVYQANIRRQALHNIHSVDTSK